MTDPEELDAIARRSAVEVWEAAKADWQQTLEAARTMTPEAAEHELDAVAAHYSRNCAAGLRAYIAALEAQVQRDRSRVQAVDAWALQSIEMLRRNWLESWDLYQWERQRLAYIDPELVQRELRERTGAEIPAGSVYEFLRWLREVRVERPGNATE